MKMQKMILPVLLGSVLLSGTAYAQIDTQTSSSSLGSTSFGYLPTAGELGTFMQSTVAPSCVGAGSSQVCTSLGTNGVVGTGPGDRDNFSRVAAMPGSFTDSALGVVSTLANFACGPVANKGGCGTSLMLSSAIDTMPSGFNNSNLPPGFSNNAAADRFFLVGNGVIRSSINIGDGGVTPGMPDGFVNFIGTGAVGPFSFCPGSGFMCVSIDQSITQTIDLGGGNDMTVTTTDRTGSRNLTSGIFSPGAGLPSISGSPFTLNPGPTNTGFSEGVLRTTLDITQANADGFGALTLSMSSDFFRSTGNVSGPQASTFVTPGLETGINAGAAFGAEFATFGFP